MVGQNIMSGLIETAPKRMLINKVKVEQDN